MHDPDPLLTTSIGLALSCALLFAPVVALAAPPPPVVFEDSLETGDVCAWDASVPTFPPLANCDGLPGCEVNVASVTGACGTASDVGTYDGDRDCGFICGSNTTWDLFSTKTGHNSTFFKARVREDSDCSTSIEHRLTLTSPVGTDFDLYVWRNCTAPTAMSTTRGSSTEQIVVAQGDNTGSDDSFDYWVEVRYFSGLSCSLWTLTFEGHNC